MSLALKKTDQQAKELDLYLKKKTGLKNSASPFAIRSGNDANDNKASAEAFKVFVEKIKTAEKAEQEDRKKEFSATAMMAQSGEDVKSVIEIAQEKKLDSAETNQFIQQVKNFRTLQAFKEESVANYSAPAMDALLEKINPTKPQEEALDIQKISEDAISMVSMDVASQGRQDTKILETEAEFKKINLANQSPESIADAYADLDQKNAVVQNLNTALHAVAPDGQEPTDILQENLVDDVDVDEPEITTVQDARNNGAKVYLAVGADYYNITDLGDSVSESADGAKQASKEDQKAVFKDNEKTMMRNKNVRMVAIQNHARGSIFELKNMN